MTNENPEHLQVKNLEHLSFAELEVELTRLSNLDSPRHSDSTRNDEITNEIDRRLEMIFPSFIRMNRVI
jgi:hypothetical protein